MGLSNGWTRCGTMHQPHSILQRSVVHWRMLALVPPCHQLKTYAGTYTGLNARPASVLPEGQVGAPGPHLMSISMKRTCQQVAGEPGTWDTRLARAVCVRTHWACEIMHIAKQAVRGVCGCVCTCVSEAVGAREIESNRQTGHAPKATNTHRASKWASSCSVSNAPHQHH